ncbi:hypothetical protein B0T13DRAFT_535440 [Neurospora crassa]|nr:hypothetical protein B0T13DRAFT_535440 [Neurospora crassa]
MSFFSRAATVLSAAALFLSFGTVEAGSPMSNLRQPASISYRGRDDCPTLCSVTGPDPGSWPAYHSLSQVAHCKETVFYHFSIYDDVDDGSSGQRIYACTSYGALQKPGADMSQMKANADPTHTPTNVTLEFGGWNETAPHHGVDLRSLSRSVRRALAAGYTSDDKQSLVLFVQTVTGTAGLYLGRNVNIQSTAPDALIAFENALYASNNTGGSKAIQLCGHDYDGDHVVGFIATSNTSFTPVQQAIRSWKNATCLSFDTVRNIPATVDFTTPLVSPSNATTNSTYSASTALRAIRGTHLQTRAECRTIQVASGDSCAKLATKCGISPSDFTKYNPDSKLCSSLMPLQYVCCSSGTLPDFTPQKNSDGSCASYAVVQDDTCSAIAAAHSLTVDQIESFNKQTWGWSGCSRLMAQAVICLSDGTPPMPAPLANAVCGPQKPGTKKPDNMDDIQKLNPCPLNACCDVWGQCGITAEFCTDTNTGAPGTAKPNTNGCISNCGTNVVKGKPPAQWISLGYYEAYSLGGRSCLYQDVRQIDTNKYSHIHFAFGDITPDFKVSAGDVISAYEFEAFRSMTNVHRVISFGGWAFSTDAATYNIFRTGVTAANRLTLATNIANFVKEKGLDGVDIDWEYPGEPDIPGPPPGAEDEGTNYLAFLVVLKNLLPGKTVSIAAPASYWYLKQFPIAQISKVVDYIVLMCYDLHGQWDYGNKWSQEGCANGNCLRSHVNLTETRTALAMITKAGVDSGKVVVGVSSYGRSFNMADAGCYSKDCFFTGSATASDASKGPCTDTAGYISNAEINDIIVNNASRVNQNFIDSSSNSRIVVYDNNQWVAFMDDSIRAARTAIYKGLGMGGTSNWATDLEKYHDAPSISKDWSTFRLSIKRGDNPYAVGDRHGNWTDLSCTDPAIQNAEHIPPQERWNMLDGSDAWRDIMKVWFDYQKPSNTPFTEAVSYTIHGPPSPDCGTLARKNVCEQTVQCSSNFGGGGSGAVGYEIWNSMVIIHEMYATYVTALYQAAAATLDPALKDFENQFAPIPKKFDDSWLGILLACVGLAGTVGVSGFFNTALKSMPYWRANSVSYDNWKDTAKALVSFGTSIAGTLTGKKRQQKQDAFSDYMGNVVSAWANVTEMSLRQLFNGEPESVELLTSLVANGHFIDGSVNGGGSSPTDALDTTANSPLMAEVRASISKAFFAFALPSIWSVSGTTAFIMDSGFDCGTVDPMGEYLDKDTQHKTAGCYNGKLYYLAYPSGPAEDCSGGDEAVVCRPNTFSAPPGIDTLDGTRFGGVKVSDLITGAVRTYIQNGNKNGGEQVDPTHGGSLDGLMDQDVTTPGFIRIPVCSASVAFGAWSDTSVSSDVDNYPCYIKPSPDYCEASSFVDQTSDASPSTSDCMGIVRNIQGTQGQWTVENGQQHQLVQYGACKFGIQGLNKHGNGWFHVGAQDIVDIITDSINKFGGSGRVGAKGLMDCKGNINSQDVEWGLY